MGVNVRLQLHPEKVLGSKCLLRGLCTVHRPGTRTHTSVGRPPSHPDDLRGPQRIAVLFSNRARRQVPPCLVGSIRTPLGVGLRSVKPGMESVGESRFGRLRRVVYGELKAALAGRRPF